MSEKLQLEYAEFYITNSCNFNCSGCNHFNNLNFSGTQRWSDYADIYAKWSKLVDIKSWTILGGEPMMNPTYLDWLENIHRLWPRAQGRFLTNGYFLKPDNRILYDIINHSQGHITLSIGLHNSARRQEMLDIVASWLQAPIITERVPNDLRELPNFDQNWCNSYSKIRDTSWPDCPTVEDWNSLPDHVRTECEQEHRLSPEILADSRKGWKLVDDNGVTVLIDHEDFFHQNNLTHVNHGYLGLHNSDSIKAHDICAVKKCHNFIHGKLFKCGVVGLLPELDQQFNLKISQEDRKLIQSYQPATPDMPWSALQNFIKNLDNSIAQCKFCPEHSEAKQISAEHGKKIKILKKIKEQNET